MDTYIKHLTINNVRNITGLSIPLSGEKRKHLIFTGKNGSGKTTVLLEIQKALEAYESLSKHQAESYDYLKSSIDAKKQLIITNPEYKLHYEMEIAQAEHKINNLSIHLQFSNSENIQELIKKDNFILAFFNAKRHSSLDSTYGINKLVLKKAKINEQTLGSSFLQFIVNMKADRAFAWEEGETITVEKIDKWFENLENQLKEIFDVKKLELKFDRHNYNFNIIIDDNITFDFNTLSDGYSAIISIISDVIMRMEMFNAKAYDLEGIVIIDEIETHLHVDLQKKILPFLISFFPKIQFIITTHSPFVLISLRDAVICDLETNIITNDLSQYSYEDIVENYFKIDQYSEFVKKKIERFEELIKSKELSIPESVELKNLRDYFAHSPKFLSNEITSKLLELQLFEITQNKN